MPASPYFSILVPVGQGNVIVVGNSGMFADDGTPSPSCGLVPMQNNLLFLLRCLGCLNGMRTPPVPGKCPQLQAVSSWGAASHSAAGVL